ncbi:chemotaxis protein CheW [Luteimonas huabeiensis]|uniref:chemotaxis protein CheW n=1 Tax=Luteimonas huabeiensis TaxID=1244513 RepID=UPI00046423C4|nr:chemotaxis protein CheW [Luteimonas huabeiensis]
MNDAPAAPAEIRGVLIQIAQARLLLPNATISEVLSYADPEPVDGAPDWLLGRIAWRGWSLPLVAFARMAGLAADERGGLGSKVAVMKNLRAGDRLPYIALLTQGFPRLVNVSARTLEADDGDGALPPAVSARVRIRDDAALVPDLDAVAARVDEALR